MSVNPRIGLMSIWRSKDTSCILAWLIEQGYEVYAFMADVGQEEASKPNARSVRVLTCLRTGLRSGTEEGSGCWCKEVLP